MSDELQIVHGITGPEIGLKPLGKILKERLAIPRPLLTLLFFFNDFPTDQPIGDNLSRINRTSNARPGRFQYLSDALVKLRSSHAAPSHLLNPE